MNKEESLALYEKGEEAWNVWANDMLAKKATLEENKQWQINKLGLGDNQATIDWINDSSVDFSEYIFKEYAGFSHFIFPYFASFNDAKFDDVADFEYATFSGDALFFSAKFGFKSEFKNTLFKGNVVFENAKFRGNIHFNQALFETFTSFKEANFEQGASFIAIRGQSFFSFNATKFHVVPNFNQANFTEAPQLENIDFSNVSNYMRYDDLDNASSRWRSLKRLATQGHDHERELIFFAEEIKSQRGIQDKALPNPLNYLDKKPVWPGGVRYWFGYFYQFFSDFGRSVMRPIASLVGFGVLFFALYLNSSTEDKYILTNANFISPVALSCDDLEAAIYLSARSTLPFIPATSYSEKINQSYACLYGEISEGKANIPNAVVFFSIVQTMLSTILTFLSLLALRNHFRIK